MCVYKLKDILLLDTLAMALHRGGSLLESEDVPDPGLLLEGPLDLLKRGLFNKRKLHVELLARCQSNQESQSKQKSLIFSQNQIGNI